MLPITDRHEISSKRAIRDHSDDSVTGETSPSLWFLAFSDNEVTINDMAASVELEVKNGDEVVAFMMSVEFLS